ncbi:MAG: GTPase Era [Deltaproteobacteria bacterium]|nr:GTPase Era [Deltaproteobacteria bacterium]MBI3391473.1 GTPase Era [Deltaproteobacteria bacterium]
MESTVSEHRSGFVALLGRPNVGKSTLLNALVGRKVAAVTPKPQTTRTRILGIKTLPQAQVLFLDTPGVHEPRGLLNARMVDVARRALDEADVVLWLVDAAAGVQPADRRVHDLARDSSKPLIVALTKIDLISKDGLLPVLGELGRLCPEWPIVPVSAITSDNLDRLLAVLAESLPLGPALYPGDEITDQSERVIVAEIIREKVILETREEVPYAVAVTIDEFTEKPKQSLVVIKATINVARDSQKPIVIGQRGSRIKAIGQAAREEIETLLDRRVFLELFVRVTEDWPTHPARLKEFGL